MSSATAAAAPAAPARRGHPLGKIVRLHFVDRSRMIDGPLLIMGGVVVVVVLVMVLLVSFTDVPRAELSEGFRYNQAAIWCLSGYFMNIGVMAYARTMPYAMGLGATRRQYFWGTTVALALEALVIAVMMVVFLFLERLTGHWFTGARMFDTYLTGNGDYGSLFAIGFGLSAAMLFLGSLFAALWMRWGGKGVVACIAGTVLVLLGLVALVLSLEIDVVAWFVPFGFWKVAAVLLGISAVSALGSWLVLRRAPLGR
ncbi:hypothetical protein GCM10022377_24330 [Zhihengliuella alba]|uniref:ABC transporter permease n=1 Tax=Zhihengliuella alba TaxID=547018 RepID=A0ABP7DUU5_9MICC